MNYKKHLKNEVKSTIILKRCKIEDAFNIIRQPLSDFLSREENNVVDESGTTRFEFKKTEFINSSNDKIINYEAFSKLMKNVDPNKSDNQIEILFKLLDKDENQLLSKLTKKLFNFIV